MTDKEVMQQALDALLDLQSLDSQDVWLDRWSEAITALKVALEQPVQEQQQVGPVEDMLLRRAVLRSAKIVSDGRFVTKQAALDIAPPLPVQEPVADRAFLEQTLVAMEGVIDVADRNTDEFDALRACVVGLTLMLYTTPPLPVQEPVAWDKPSASFDEWWDSDRRRDNANPFQTDSFAYWAFEGWQAALAQRQWVGLNDVDVKNLELTSATSSDVRNISAELKEKNT